MPRLPDAFSLGDRPTLTPERGVYGYKAGQVEEANAEAGQSMRQTGEVLDARVKKLNDQNNEVQTAYAESAFWKAHTDTVNNLKASNDYGTFGQQYRDQMKAASDNAAAMIPEGPTRALVRAKMDETINRTGMNTVTELARSKEVDQGKASLADLTENNGDAYLRAPDEATKASILAATQNAISASRDKGYIDAAKAAEMKRSFVQNLSMGRLEMLPPAERIKVLQGITGSASTTSTITATTAKEAIDHVITNFEGPDVVPNDGGKGASKFGINQTANPDVNVSSLRRDQAEKIYKDRYWDAIGADNLPANMRLAAFDTAVNFGVPKAKEMLAEAGNDPNKLVALRSAEHDRLVTEDPAKYGQYAEGWKNRDAALATGDTPQAGYQKRGDWTDFIPPEKVPALLDKAQSELKTQTSDIKERNAYDMSLRIFNSSNSGSLDTLPTQSEITKAVDTGNLLTSQGLGLLEKSQHAFVEIKKSNDAIAGVQDALMHGTPIDTSNKLMMTAADKVYQDQLSKYADRPPEDQQNIKAAFAGQVGAVPASLNKEISEGLRNNDPSQVASTVNLVSKLRATNPRLIASLKQDDVRFANNIQAKLDAGFAPNVAVQQVTEAMQLPEAQKEARKKEYDTLNKANPSDSWVANKVNSIWRADPDQDAVMLKEFDNAAMQEFTRTGDIEGARQTALDQVQRVWGVTDVGNNRHWMKYAPEKFYGVTGSDAGWMNDQLKADVKTATGSEPKLGDLIVTPHPTRTGQDGKPLYIVTHKNANGVLENVSGKDGKPLVWVPDYQSSDAFKRSEAEKADSISGARIDRSWEDILSKLRMTNGGL